MTSILEIELEGTGLKVLHASNDDYNAPFDIEVIEGSAILVGIENKDITGQPQGVWQKKNALRRKKRYAEANQIRKVLTTVTDRDRDLVGFCEGLVSRQITDFDFRKEELIKEILSARGPAV